MRRDLAACSYAISADSMTPSSASDLIVGGLPAKTNQKFSPAERYATGIRNAVGIAVGFAGANKQPDAAAHRPAGVTIGGDGALYITDDKAGRVWKVVYKGP